METNKLIAIQYQIRTVRDTIATLLSDSGVGGGIPDSRMRDIYYRLNDMSIQISRIIDDPEPVEITLTDNVPCMVVEPPDIPERDLSDFDI